MTKMTDNKLRSVDGVPLIRPLKETANQIAADTPEQLR